MARYNPFIPLRRLVFTGDIVTSYKVSMPEKKLRIMTGQIKSYFVDEEDVMELVMAGTRLHGY